MWEEGGQKRQEAKQANLRRQEKEEMPVASVPRVGRSSGKLDERGVSRISIRIGSVRIWSHQSFARTHQSHDVQCTHWYGQYYCGKKKIGHNTGKGMKCPKL